MVCSIADNRPLLKLERELNLPRRCHGKRKECIKGFESSSGDFVMGLPGTAIGYCQALFNYAGSASLHTEKVTKMLQEIDAPWALSHELFWGHRSKESATDYIEQATRPLIGTGRVPILITALDPKSDRLEINTIVATRPLLPENETLLVRIVLTNDESLNQARLIMRELLVEARASGKMPKWWPLLQGDLPLSTWQSLKTAMGSDWDFVNVAINPFVDSEIVAFLRDQVTVAQIVVGLAEGISKDGRIMLAAGMKITGAGDGASYSMPEYAEMIRALSFMPALIVLGPSQAGWTDEINRSRVSAVLPLLREACNTLWQELEPARRDAVWSLDA